MKLKASLFVVMVLSSCISAQTTKQLPLTLTISGPQTVAVGGSVIIQPRLTNVSNNKLTVWSGREYTVIIRDESGKNVNPKSGDWDGSSGVGVIEPGEERSDFSIEIGWRFNHVPGKYVVQLVRRIDYDDPKSPSIKSNEIAITVVPAPVDGKK